MKNRNLVIVFVFILCAISQPVCAAEEETYTGPTYAELQAMNPIQDNVPDAKSPVVTGLLYGNLRITENGELAANIGQGFTYNQATPNDVEGLHELINTKVTQENGTLVVLPTKFRRSALMGQIKQQQLFVAKDSEETIVGFKKLYVVTDPDEKHEILEGEIRCQGAESERLYSGSYSPDLMLSAGASIPLPENVVVLYNGADFTHRRVRGKGVNRALMQKALKLVTSKTIRAVRETNANELAMVYGLVDAIAGATPGDETDRTSSIIKCFAPFADQIQQETYGDAPRGVTSYDRFTAFKPSFDPNATECVPLPDEHSVKGKGCVLCRTLVGKEKSE